MRTALAAFVVLVAAVSALPADASQHARLYTVTYSITSLPKGFVGQPYDVTISATVDGAGCCIAPNNIDAPGLTATTPNGMADSSMELKGIPTRPGPNYLITEIYVDVQNGVAKDNCCSKQWIFNVAAAKKALTYTEAKAYVQDVETAIDDERKARTEISLRTDAHLEKAAQLLSNASSDLYQLQAGLPEHTFSGPDPTRNVKSARATDYSVGEVLAESMAGNNFGKGIDQSLATKLVNELAPALTQKKHALSYTQQIAAHLGP